MTLISTPPSSKIQENWELPKDVLSSSPPCERFIYNSETVESPNECSSHLLTHPFEEDEVNDTVLNPLFPPISTHYSSPTVQFYRFTSAILSSLFLVFVVLLCAIIKSIPTLGWTIWSWCQFKHPDRFRPFYEEERARKHIKPGKLKCDIGYYAQLVGLECDESKIETEDGFILTIHHIVDRRPAAVASKSRLPLKLG